MSRAGSANAGGAEAGARPGRPPVFSEAERTKRIRAAAEQVFTTSGYGAATMEEVARVAGMSKKTIYAHYADKRRLLAAVVTAEDDLPCEGGSPTENPLAELRRRLIAVVEFVLTPRQLRLARLLISQAEQAPDLADLFHARVMMKARVYIEAALERAKPEGFGVVRGSTSRVADALIGAALGDMHIHALFGRTDGLSRKRIAAQVDFALRIFAGAGG